MASSRARAYLNRPTSRRARVGQRARQPLGSLLRRSYRGAATADLEHGEHRERHQSRRDEEDRARLTTIDPPPVDRRRDQSADVEPRVEEPKVTEEVPDADKGDETNIGSSGPRSALGVERGW